VTLELSLTALIGRLDPFRLLVLREMQRRPDYDVGRRSLASIQWDGDVIAAKKESTLWDPAKAFEKVSRGLLGNYYSAVYWEEAHAKVLDALTESHVGDWFSQLRLTTPEAFGPRMRSEATRAYSALSKGLHHEFVVPTASLYDRSTVLTLVGDALRIAATLAFISHGISECHCSLRISEAARCYQALQDFEVNNVQSV
jgi:hypothetical protein